MSENEAIEEIKQLAKQLQNLYERIPQKNGPATNVILTLLDICRTAHAQTTNNAVTLKPPDLPHEQTKQLNRCNGNCGVDKETNTSFENLVCKMISDKCDNHVKGKCSNKNKCCEANNKTINYSSNSINFDNLQLKCICSSDDSLEESQIPGKYEFFAMKRL